MPSSEVQRYIVLLPRGLFADNVGLTTPDAASFLTALNPASGKSLVTQRRVLSSAKISTRLRVLDSIRENGAKLVEMTPEAASQLRTEQPGLRLVPVIY